eukprot:CAMPEP_0197022228 /NCGR_PEP_ID=MMETSP1384-20130603/3134_1 /TAXON_ID=29189 /ORGANISM="Ammonia sp." /LENGTH=550 /DNA_ID=CAMNT_0042450231 /DNA_START=47 /DNA_END=1696 /DNA_ORIENTATION=-
MRSTGVDDYRYNEIRGRGRGRGRGNHDRHHSQHLNHPQQPPQRRRGRGRYPPAPSQQQHAQQQAPQSQYPSQSSYPPQYAYAQHSRYWRPRGGGYRSKRSENRPQSEQAQPRYAQRRTRSYRYSPNTKPRKQVPAAFDAHQILTNNTVKTPEIQIKLVTYYHTNPVHQRLEFDQATKPSLITSTGIDSLLKLDLNRIPIDYSTLRDPNTQNTRSRQPKSLREQQPPASCCDTSRIDPFCYEIVKIDAKMKQKFAELHSPDCKDGDADHEGSNDTEQELEQKEKEEEQQKNQDRIRFITYRHNLRQIANAVLWKLGGLRIYDKTGVNIAVHRKANDIFLENIVEKDDNRQPSQFVANMVYGYLLEHVLEELSSSSTTAEEPQKQQPVEIHTVKPMEYQHKCLERDEIRALNEIRIGQDIEVLCAAEMDAIISSEDDDDSVQVIEIKSSQINERNASRIDGIPDVKLMKFWTQCRFGGVDAVLVALQTNGIIQRTQMIQTEKLEKLFPLITSKCVQMVHDVLKWLKQSMMKLEERQLYVLSFDTNDWNNTKW